MFLQRYWFVFWKHFPNVFPRHSEDVLYLNTQVEPAESAYEANILNKIYPAC